MCFVSVSACGVIRKDPADAVPVKVIVTLEAVITIIVTVPTVNGASISLG